MTDTDPIGQAGILRPTAFGLLRLALGALLLFAAAVKFHQLATEPTANDGLLSYRWSLILQVEFEIVFGLLLVSGLHPRFSWAAAVACFSFFIAVTLYKALSGETTCGCFGKIRMHPWHTLILDVGCLLLLLAFRPRMSRSGPQRLYRMRMATIGSLALLAGIPAAVIMARYEPAVLSQDGQIVGSQRFVLLDVQRWAGRKFPLAPYIEGGGDWSRGDHTIVLFQHDCPHCRQTLPELARRHASRGGCKDAPRLSFVELPPYAEAAQSPLPADGRYDVYRLSSRRDWFVVTPAVLELSDGIVLGAVEGAGRKNLAFQSCRPDAASQPAFSATGDEHDLGYVEVETTHKVSFRIDNPSEKPLNIRSARSECACMLATFYPGSVQAKGQGTLEVAFKAPKESIRYDKRVVLATDDPHRRLLAYTIKADVGLPLAVKEGSLDFGIVPLGATRKAAVTLTNRGRRPVTPVLSTSSVKTCLATVPRQTIPAGGSLAIPVSLSSDGMAVGAGEAVVQIHLDSSEQPRLEVPVSYVIVDRTAGALSLGDDSPAGEVLTEGRQ